MQHLYFLRHCKTVLNEQGRVSGLQNSKLCNEAAVSNVELVKESSHLIIISSDLGRCRQTIDLLIPLLEIVPIVYYSKLLRERNMGIFEGEKRTELVQKYPSYFENNRFCFKMTPPGGESYQQVEKRIQYFVEKKFTKILNENKGSILICAHNQVMKLLYCELLKISTDEIWNNLDFIGGEIRQIY